MRARRAERRVVLPVGEEGHDESDEGADEDVLPVVCVEVNTLEHIWGWGIY